jgi:hypothetical protein
MHTSPYLYTKVAKKQPVKVAFIPGQEAPVVLVTPGRTSTGKDHHRVKDTVVPLGEVDDPDRPSFVVAGYLLCMLQMRSHCGTRVDEPCPDDLCCSPPILLVLCVEPC